MGAFKSERRPTRSHKVFFRTTELEWETLEERAKKNGTDAVEIIRDALELYFTMSAADVSRRLKKEVKS